LDMEKILSEITRLPGVPGYEAGVNGYISGLFREYADEVRTDALENVISRVGKEGAFVVAPDGTEFMKPGFTVPVVNTTGAGDAFNAGFITAILSGKSLEDATVWGNAVAAYKVGGNGSRHTPSVEQLHEFMASLGYEI